ncbi:acyl-CoA dehydrogenase family protein [Parasphingorhabdus sp.]|uniref:acyl-CoA dehydrogenase family protein n=1 Tax=Parasphingorhabdus sp. TaxID=2709688 RepID=UPI0032EC1727
MTFAVTEAQIMLADMLHRFLQSENELEARRHRLANPQPERLALWPRFAEQGILGVPFSEGAGGFGGSVRDLAVVMEHIGRGLVVEPFLVSAVCGWLLEQCGDLEEVSRIIAGQRIYAFAHAEGGDPFELPATTASYDGETYRVNGTKLAVRHADLANAFIVTAVLDGAPACFQVESGEAGISIEGSRFIDASSGASLRFKNCTAKRICGAQALQGALARYFVGLAAETCGIALATNEATFAYLRTRKQFGVALSSFQALQHRAADMFMAAEEARHLCDMAIEAIDAGRPDSSELASAVKALADTSGRRVGHEAVQMHGGMGVSDELNISHFARRLAAIRAEMGGGDAHRLRYLNSSVAVEVDGHGDPFRAEVREFVRTNLPVELKRKGALGLEIEKEDYVRWQKILYKNGYFAGAWPKEYGGGGWDLARQLTFVQEAALNRAPMIMPYGVNMVGPVIYTFGTDEQKRRYLPDILSSDCWWCQGYSEPNAGSDLASLKTTATRVGDDYIVNGTKMWTTEAHWADMMHCLVRTERNDKPQRGISFLLIDMKTPGITVHPIVTIDGQHHTNQIFLDDVRVPAENLVGMEGNGWTIAKFLLSNERVAIADTGPKLLLLSHIRQLLDDVSPSPLRTIASVKLAEAAVELKALCAMEASFVKYWSEGGARDGPQASVLKVRGTEILQKLSEIALEIEGPLGAIHDPEDLNRDGALDFNSSQRASLMANQYLYGRCWSIFGGTNEIQRNIISRSIIGR